LTELLVADRAAVDRDEAMAETPGGRHVRELAGHLAAPLAFAQVVDERTALVEQRPSMSAPRSNC
jgi:hypothetical protein